MMRDFLIDKLRTAEIALKNSMMENIAARKQAAADQEVRIRVRVRVSLM
jgi:hypothetical protein